MTDQPGAAQGGSEFILRGNGDTQVLPRFRLRAGTLAPLALALSLSGCQAMYDDTKGWANRVEASLMKAAKDFGNNLSEAQSRPPTGVEWVGEEATVSPAPGKPQGLVEEAAAAMAAPEEAVTAADESKAAIASASAPVPAPPPSGQQAPEAMDPTGPMAEAKPASPPRPKLKPAKPAENAEKKTPGAPKAANSSKAPMVVHLSSLRSEKAAKKEWEALKQAFPEQLSAMSPRFARTEIAQRGTFYRVLAGPLPSKQAAKQLCGALKAKKQYCQVMSAPPSA